MGRRVSPLGNGKAVAAAVAVVLALATACSATPEPRPAPTAAPTVTVVPTPGPSRTAPPEPAEVDPLGDGPYTVLLVGTDSRDPADLTGNADTIMLVHVAGDRESVHLVSLTRDMYVPIPGLGEGKINSAFSRGGTETLAATVSALLGGLEIDLVMQSNFAGFIALTRALDGFTVENRHASTVEVLSTGRIVEFPAGPVELENTDGLIYVRQRKGLPLGDLDRTERQRAAVVGMMAALQERLGDPVALAELVALLHRNVKITGDLSVEDALSLAPLLGRLERDDVVGLMVPITGFGTVAGASVNLVDEAQTAALGEALRTDTMETYVTTYGTDYAP
jgi:LCP family protein required for cell wall assembly